MSVVDGFVEIRLKNPDDFLKIRETLTRIGVASRHEKVLYQSCHILHKQGKYYILHFKECFLLDGRTSTLSDNDIARRNTIVNILAEWGLLDIVDSSKCKEPRAPISQIKILPYKEKKDWRLEAKYNIGKKR